MQGGFSFCGVDIAKFGLEYVPTLDQTYVFGSAPYEVHQESFDAHHGGYFYGTTVQPKDFILRCLFQDQNIVHGSLSYIENFFRRGKTGRLVFDKREWLWYTATVISVDLNDLRNYSNGFITITMRAYYPFSRHDYLYIGDDNAFNSYIAANSGLLSSEETPAVSIGQVKNNTNILLYNGGTERAGVAIALAGDSGEGVRIINNTTNQEARFIGFNKSQTTNSNSYILSDSINGKTIYVRENSKNLAFRFHDYGFIELEPSYPIIRNIYASYEEGSADVSILDIGISDEVVGQHIRINNEWYKIISKNQNILTLNSPMTDSGSCYTNIVTMNEISISLSVGAELTKLDFIYKPTFQ